MSTWNVFEFIVDIYSSLSELATDLVSFFSNSLTIGSQSFSYFEVLFGGGFIVLIGFIAVKFILDIVL